MDKTYINSLLKKNDRDLDLYEIKDILDALVEKDKEAWKAMNFMDRKEKDYYALLKREYRDKFISEGKKATEGMLDEFVRTDKRWKEDLLALQDKVFEAGTMYRENYKKWERTYQACVMSISAKNKNIII